MADLNFFVEKVSNVDSNTQTQLNSFKKIANGSEGYITANQLYDENNLGGYIKDENNFPFYKLVDGKIFYPEESKYISYNDEIDKFVVLNNFRLEAETTTEAIKSKAEFNLIIDKSNVNAFKGDDNRIRYILVNDKGIKKLAIVELLDFTNYNYNYELYILNNVNILWKNKENIQLHKTIVNNYSKNLKKEIPDNYPDAFYLNNSANEKTAILNFSCVPDPKKIKIYELNEIANQISKIFENKYIDFSKTIKIEGIANEVFERIGTNRITEISNVNDNSKYIGVRYVVDDKSFFSKGKNVKTSVIASSGENSKKTIIGAVLSFSNGEEVFYTINRTVDGIEKFSYIASTIDNNDETKQYNLTKVWINNNKDDKHDYYITDKIPNNRSILFKDLKDSIIFFACNEDIADNKYSEYWADDVADSYAVYASSTTDNKQAKKNKKIKEQIPFPKEIIRYEISTYDKDGKLDLENSGIYNDIKAAFNADRASNIIFTDVKANSAISDFGSAEINLYDTIFEWKFEANSKANTVCKLQNEKRKAESWAYRPISILKGSDGNYNTQKFDEQKEAKRWLSSSIKTNESIVVKAKNSDVGIGLNSKDFNSNNIARFYLDREGYLTIGYGFTNAIRSVEISKGKTIGTIFNNFINIASKKYDVEYIGKDKQVVFYHKNDRTPKSGTIVKDEKGRWISDFGDEEINTAANAMTYTEVNDVFEKVISDMVAEVYDGLKNSSLNISIGQLLTLTGFRYNGLNGNLRKCGVSGLSEIGSDKNAWEKVETTIYSDNTIYFHQFRDEITKFSFCEDEETVVIAGNNKPQHGRNYLIDIQCYARPVEQKQVEAIKISTFYKPGLFEKKDDGTYKIKGDLFGNDACLFTYVTKQYAVDAAQAAVAAQAAAEETKMPYSKIKEFVERFSAKRTKEQPTEQVFIDADGYYDFYSGMTPYIKAGFRGIEKDDFNYIDSIITPYFVSLKVEDDGVKKIELQLFDKDFGSYQKGIVYEGGILNKRRIYSLETLIKQALSTPNAKNAKETNDDAIYNGNETNQHVIADGYLQFSEAKNYSPVNLKIRFGYADDNMYINNNNEYTDNYYSNKNKIRTDKRDYRWWDVNILDTEKSESVKVKTYINDLNDSKFSEGEKTFNNKAKDHKNSKDSSIAESEKEISSDQTTKMSYNIDCMIIGYKTTLQPNGILYTITAIETKEAELMKTRILQRFATISAYPEEMLYLLMKMFNEANGENVKSCPVKLYILEDNEQSEGRKAELVNEIDMSKLTDAEKNKFGGEENLNAAEYVKKMGEEIDPKKFKAITLNLGGEAALRNYRVEQTSPKLYKNVYTLLNEFCAACPPLKVKRSTYETTNINGEKVSIENMPEASRRLSWFSCNHFDDKENPNNYVSIFFYYRKPERVARIKRYTWGPENCYQTVVTNVSIENANEFAVLSGIESFNPSTSQVTIRTKEGAVYSKQITDYKEVRSYNGITANQTAANNYELALSSCMYKGSIQILGDPSYLFTGMKMQPCTYPIYLRVLVPINTFEQVAGNTNEDYNAVLNLNKKYGSKRIFGNQQMHEMSGYYVITKITHNITASGFTTTLDVMSYPGIEKDIEVKS